MTRVHIRVQLLTIPIIHKLKVNSSGFWKSRNPIYEYGLMDTRMLIKRLEILEMFNGLFRLQHTQSQ